MMALEQTCISGASQIVFFQNLGYVYNHEPSMRGSVHHSPPTEVAMEQNHLTEKRLHGHHHDKPYPICLGHEV